MLGGEVKIVKSAGIHLLDALDWIFPKRGLSYRNSPI